MVKNDVSFLLGTWLALLPSMMGTVLRDVGAGAAKVKEERPAKERGEIRVTKAAQGEVARALRDSGA